MKKAAFLLYLFFLSQTFCQVSKKEDSPLKLRPILFETLQSYSSDSTIDCYILYRVKSKFLTFSKISDSEKDIYTANGDLIFEILNDKNNTIGREYKQLQITRYTPVDENVRIDDMQGYFNFNLKPDIYIIVSELKDNGSGRNFIDKNTKIEIKKVDAKTSTATSLLFIEPIKMESLSGNQILIRPLNQGGNILIGQSGNAMLQYISFDTLNKIQVSWTLNGKPEDDNEPIKEISDSSFQIIKGFVSAVHNSSDPIFYVNKNTQHSNVIIISPPIENLETGKYKLNLIIKQGSSTEKLEYPFEVIWYSKPKSLANIRLAIDALKHIATEEELSQISSFNISKARKAFYEFWKKRSPDTTRAFNPSMAEYYRRVDEAILKFSKENESDGYLTDRGRIFILFGSPTRTNRLLKPNAPPTEIWTYENIKKRFIFRDEKKTGNFILVRTEEY